MIRSKIAVIGGDFAAVKRAKTLRKALPREYFSIPIFLGQGSRQALDGLSLYIYFSPPCRATFFRHFLRSRTASCIRFTSPHRDNSVCPPLKTSSALLR